MTAGGYGVFGGFTTSDNKALHVGRRMSFVVCVCVCVFVCVCVCVSVCVCVCVIHAHTLISSPYGYVACCD